MSWQNNIAILQYHSSLVADADRVDRYREAIHAVVRPGDGGGGSARGRARGGRAGGR